MVEPAPTAVPVFGSVNDTLLRLRMVGLLSGTQFAPPSVVRKMVPPVKNTSKTPYRTFL